MLTAQVCVNSTNSKAAQLYAIEVYSGQESKENCVKKVWPIPNRLLSFHFSLSSFYHYPAGLTPCNISGTGEEKNDKGRRNRRPSIRELQLARKNSYSLMEEVYDN